AASSRRKSAGAWEARARCSPRARRSVSFGAWVMMAWVIGGKHELVSPAQALALARYGDPHHLSAAMPGLHAAGGQRFRALPRVLACHPLRHRTGVLPLRDTGAGRGGG